MRLINAYAVHCDRDDFDTYADYIKAFDAINEAPTVDAVPVRHGKWLDDGQYDNFFPHHEWRCSECGEHVLEIGVPWFNYCPHCGARMDEERDSDHAEEEIL